jgi:hypothetical protein
MIIYSRTFSPESTGIQVDKCKVIRAKIFLTCPFRAIVYIGSHFLSSHLPIEPPRGTSWVLLNVIGVVTAGWLWSIDPLLFS